MIELPPFLSLKTELYIAFLASGLRKSELARRLGIPSSIVDRLFDPNHQSRMDQMDAAFRALGKSLTIEISDAGRKAA